MKIHELIATLARYPGEFEVTGPDGAPLHFVVHDISPDPNSPPIQVERHVDVQEWRGPQFDR